VKSNVKLVKRPP